VRIFQNNYLKTSPTKRNKFHNETVRKINSVNCYYAVSFPGGWRNMQKNNSVGCFVRVWNMGTWSPALREQY